MDQRRVALLLPGQGAQYMGMGRDFVEQFPRAARVVEEAEDVLGYHLGFLSLEGKEEWFYETSKSQLAIFVVSMVLWRVLQVERPALSPAYVAGFSLGEYSALSAGGYLDFAIALRLVEKRGIWMEEACRAHPGGMCAALGSDRPSIERAMGRMALPGLWVANDNCPGQVVLSGTLSALQWLQDHFSELGIKRLVPLKVQGAFHTPLMRGAEEKLRPLLLEAPWKKGVPIALNATGTLGSGEVGSVLDPLLVQMSSPVRWQEGIRSLESLGVDLYLEVGAGHVLSGLNKKIGVKAPSVNLERVSDLSTVLEALDG